LNLHADRFAYLVDGVWLGDAASPVRFVEPWRHPPSIDLTEAALRLRVVERGGCDLAPLDPPNPTIVSRCSPTSGPTDVALTVRGPRNIPERRLARCGDHGPPLDWVQSS
jgi:hypothetical protein